MFLTLEQVKKHLNLDNDFTEDDVYLTLLTASSEAVVQKHIDDKFENLVDDEGELPAPLLSAMLLFIGNMYAHRESVTNIQMMEVPLAYRYILDCYKNWNPTYEEETITLYVSFVGGSIGTGKVGVPLSFSAKVLTQGGKEISGYTIKYYINGTEVTEYTPTEAGDLEVKAVVTNPSEKEGYIVSPSTATKTYAIAEKDILTLSFTSSGVGKVGVPLTYTSKVTDAEGNDVTSYFTIKYYIGTDEYPSGTYIPTSTDAVIVKALVLNPEAKEGCKVSPSFVTLSHSIYDRDVLTLAFTDDTPSSVIVGTALTYNTTIKDSEGNDYTSEFNIKYTIDDVEYPSGSYTPTTAGDVTIKAIVTNPTAKQGYIVAPEYKTHITAVSEEKVAFYGHSDIYNDFPTSDEEVETNGIGCHNGFTFHVSTKYPNAKIFWVAVNKNYRGRVFVCHDTLYLENYIDLPSYRVYYSNVERGIATQDSDGAPWHFVVPFSEFEGVGSGIAYLGANLTDITLPTTEAEIESGVDFYKFSNLSTMPETGYFKAPKAIWVAVKSGHSATITNSFGASALEGTKIVGDYTLHYAVCRIGFCSVLNCTIV